MSGKQLVILGSSNAECGVLGNKHGGRTYTLPHLAEGRKHWVGYFAAFSWHPRWLCGVEGRSWASSGV